MQLYSSFLFVFYSQSLPSEDKKEPAQPVVKVQLKSIRKKRITKFDQSGQQPSRKTLTVLITTITSCMATGTRRFRTVTESQCATVSRCQTVSGLHHQEAQTEMPTIQELLHKQQEQYRTDSQTPRQKLLDHWEER